MMYRTALLAAASLTLAACAQQNFSTKMPEAVGLTDAYYKSTSSTSTYKEYLRFEPGVLTKIVFCANGDERARVEVTAPARLTGGTIEILETKVATESAGDVACVAKLEKGLQAYEIDEDETLALQPKDGWRQRYMRAGKKRPHLLAEFMTDINASAARMRAKVAAEHEAYARYRAAEARANVEQVEKIVTGAKAFAKRVGDNVRQTMDDAANLPSMTPTP